MSWPPSARNATSLLPPSRSNASAACTITWLQSAADACKVLLQAAEKQLNAERTRLDNAHLRVSTLEAQLSALAASAAPGDVAAAVFAHDKEAMALWSRVEELEQQLRAGIPQGADAQIADANIALVERLEDLEQANARMEEALLHATHNSQEEENDDQLMRLEAQRGADRDIRAALLERDRRIGELEGKLAMAQGRADGALNDAEAEVAQMRRELSAAMADSAQKDALLVAAQERLGELEAMCRNAKDVALRAEAAMKVPLIFLGMQWFIVGAA